MATYIIGDIHGCYYELITLLDKVCFNCKKDTLWLTGDLVFRGKHSLEVLRYVKSLGNDCVHIVLGNHDIHLLAVYKGVISNFPGREISSLLKAKDIDELISWLQHQPLLHIDKDKKIIMVHAGVIPQWDLNTAISYAREIENILKSDSCSLFLKIFYSNNNRNMSIDYQKNKNILVHKFTFLGYKLNVFTRIRYLLPNGELEMQCKVSPKEAPILFKPWFSFHSKIFEKYSIVFGHWGSLLGKGTPYGIYALDTGCCWGGKLTCLRWEDKKYFFQSSFDNRNLTN